METDMSRICLLLSKILGSRKGSAAAPTYTISGTVTGDVVEGVTMTLTGDASDSTTTAADGTYSFTGLSDGSYNVEPSYTGFSFTPTDSDVAVSGADQTGEDFVAAFAGPLFLNAADFATGNLSNSDGFRQYSSLFSAYPTITATGLADSNSYTPTGVTKAFTTTGSANGAFFWLLPNSITLPAGWTAMRAAVLFRISVATGSNAYMTISEENYTDKGSNSDDYIYFTRTGSADPDTMYANQAIAGSALDRAFALGANVDVTRWCWMRIELDNDGTSHASIYLIETAATTGPIDGALSYAQKQYTNIGCILRDGDEAGQTWLAGVWIGNKTDAWPTNALGSTTILW
jgi:hypothetical protein